MAEMRYWFPAKRYGWGWGLPITWEGWAVFATFISLVIAGSIMMPPGRSTTGFISYIVVLVILLGVVCWRKGEPPRWRWGDD